MILQSLEKIKYKVISCKKCSLCESRTHAVPGKGNSKAEIVFVGEAPGRSEDLKGEPFVGSAGKKLSDLLEHVGLSRDSVYITNVVKCRPPENRQPTKQEKKACSDYLNRELEIINPRIICVLGNTAYSSLLGGKNITKDHGKIVRKDKRLYFVTFHPAAIIYNPKLVSSLKKDFRRLVQVLGKIKNGSPMEDFL
ncbi:MAG: uracil-DNA glycosylase [Thaumarchaeota archaeon]|nr:uracil-DNA glycosylase [Nitrososphaerota archaeon]